MDAGMSGWLAGMWSTSDESDGVDVVVAVYELRSS
jgi:hypothetical protein